MTIGVPTFVGARLTEARVARGLYKKSLGDMIGVSGAQIGHYEDGQDKPQLEKLTVLSEKLNFSIEFFSRDVWAEKLAPIFWRSQASESKSAREMTAQRATWICEVFAFLDGEVNFPRLQLPAFDLPNDFRLITGEDVERIATELRNQWSLRPDRPIPDIILALENAGIPVIQLEIPSEKQDGFCFWSKLLNRFFVGINISGISGARVRYDAAHELGHAILHSKVTPEEFRDPVKNKILEQQAHRFAGAFLFPRAAFIDEVRDLTLDYFSSLKRKWGISVAAMIYRAWTLELIDDDQRTSLYLNMTRRGWRGALREPFDTAPNEIPLERPRMLRRAVETIIGGGVFGRSTLLSSLALPETEIEQIAGLPFGYFRTAEIVHLDISARSNGTGIVDLESGNVVEFPNRRNR